MKIIGILKKSLFDGYLNTAITCILLPTILYIGYQLFTWLLIDGIFSGTIDVCRESSGFCWLFLQEKAKYILMGLYPSDQLWRPCLALGLFFMFTAFVARPKNWCQKNIFYFLLLMIMCSWLIYGGFGLRTVSSDNWGGLLLTIIVSVIGITVAYPLGVVLALARRSSLPLFKYLSIVYIEFIRGIPLISLLFMSAVVLPIFLPDGMELGKLFRAQIAMILFFSAYMAEIVRGGLQSIPSGQYEGAMSLGLNYYQRMGKVILPQALKVVIPPTVNTVMGFFKDTSLLVIIALFDLMYTAKASVTDPEWAGFIVEAYLFIAVIYFVICSFMGKYAKFLEHHLRKDG